MKVGVTVFGMVLLLGLLAGCQQASDSDVAVSAPAPSAGPKQTPEPAGKINSARTQSVLGLRPRELQQMLGVPKLVRRDAPAEVWQYRSDACVLDVFIYQVATGPQVKYAEARTVEAEPARTDDCVNTIRQQNLPDRVPT